MGEVVEVETLLGRRVSGEVLGLNPPFSHDFGEPVPELIEAGLQARAILDGLDTRATAPSSGGVETVIECRARSRLRRRHGPGSSDPACRCGDRLRRLPLGAPRI